MVGAAAVAVAAGMLTASAAAVPINVQPIGHYSTPAMAATYPVPLPAEGDVICTGQPVGPYTVEAIAWQEIGELRNLGLPVCDVIWKFQDLPDPRMRGMARSTPSITVVTMEIDLSELPPEPIRDPKIRSTVRHELGHAILRAAGYVSGTGDLDAIFTDPLESPFETTDRGHEAGAEAILVVLSEMRHDDWRVMGYLDNPSDASIRAAAALVLVWISTAT
jgi:hypothetical protein